MSTSCSRNMARTKKAPAHTACGICGNCLLRQMSAMAADAADGVRYYWSLVGPSLSASRLVAAEKDVTKTDFAFASHSVVAMESFARLADSAPAFRRTVFELSDYLAQDRNSVALRLGRLRDRHATEWDCLLDALPADSWVRAFAGKYE